MGAFRLTWCEHRDVFRNRVFFLRDVLGQMVHDLDDSGTNEAGLEESCGCAVTEAERILDDVRVAFDVWQLHEEASDGQA